MGRSSATSEPGPAPTPRPQNCLAHREHGRAGHWHILWPGHSSELPISCLPEQLLFSRTRLGPGRGFFCTVLFLVLLRSVGTKRQAQAGAEGWVSSSPGPRELWCNLASGDKSAPKQILECARLNSQTSTCSQGRGAQTPADAVLGPSLCSSDLAGMDWAAAEARLGGS